MSTVAANTAAVSAMPTKPEQTSTATSRAFMTVKAWLPLALTLFAALAFYFSANGSHRHFDYTSRIASALLRGHLGPQTKPPSWLNEMVPANGRYYSVFPLGAVISMMPVALLQKVASIKDFPGRAVATLLAAFCVYFFYQLSQGEQNSMARRIILALFPVFG